MAGDLETARSREVEAAQLRTFRDIARQVAHELKNPLTPLRFAVGRLRQQAAPGQAELLEILDGESQRIEQMARDFSSLGRLPEGPPAAVDLGELLDGLARSTLPAGISARVERDGAAPMVLGHYEPLRRAFQNLLLNAVDAVGTAEGTGAQGHGGAAAPIILSLAPSILQGRPAVQVQVADRGPGSRRSRSAGSSSRTSRPRRTAPASASPSCARPSSITAAPSRRRTPPAAAPSSPSSSLRSSMTRAPLVLLVDDEANLRRMLGAVLASEGYAVTEAPSGTEAVAAVQRRRPDAVFLDLQMPGGPDGLATLERLVQEAPGVPVIMMSGRAGLQDAVRATKLGAFHFLEKPLAPEAVLLTLRSALELARARAEAQALREALGPSATLVGSSPQMAEVRALIARAGPTETRVLITGESGTGKELVAAAIHASSARAGAAFVRVNCAAIPRELIESEMFGHERGSFTGASERRTGRFELADNGTLFLDEVGDLGIEAQAKLLRALEGGEVERVGGERPVPVDVRVVSATNKDLARAAQHGRFREDLLYRLNVFPIAIPPLRERPGDIPELVHHFVALLTERIGRAPAQVAPEAMDALVRHAWPGNVRELANIVERLIILSPRPTITGADVAATLPPASAHAGPSPGAGRARRGAGGRARSLRAHPHLPRPLGSRRQRRGGRAAARDRPCEPVPPDEAPRDRPGGVTCPNDTPVMGRTGDRGHPRQPWSLVLSIFQDCG